MAYGAGQFVASDAFPEYVNYEYEQFLAYINILYAGGNTL